MSQRANGRVIEIPGLHPDAIEDAAHRWERGVCFNLPGGLRQFLVGGPMHFRRADRWEEYHLEWEGAGSPWAGRIIAAPYELHCAERANAASLMRWVHGGHYLELAAAALERRQPGNTQPVATPQPIIGLPGTPGFQPLTRQAPMNWAGAFGAGIDLSLVPWEYGVRKEVTLQEAPQGIGASENNFRLRWRFSSDLAAHSWVDGRWVRWDGQPLLTGERVAFLSGGEPAWWWRPPLAVDARGEICVGQLELERDGDQLYVSDVWPWEWLQRAAYPVVLDPDAYYGTADDGYAYGTHAVYATARSTCAGYDNGSAFFAVGQNFTAAKYFPYRGFFVSDTSGIGAESTITQGNLYLTGSFDSSVVDFDVEICPCNWTVPLGPAAEEANYDAALAATVDVVWRNTAGIAMNTPYASPNLDVSWINTAGDTKCAMRSKRDYDAIAPTGGEFIGLHSQTAATQAYRPYLSIIARPRAAALKAGEYAWQYG